MTQNHSDTTIFPTTRLTLLARLGDPASRAWDEFFAIYGPVIYRMARHDGLDDHDAEEVVAVVMRYFFGTVAAGFQFNPKRGRFRHYLRRATNNVILRVRREGTHSATKGCHGGRAISNSRDGVRSVSKNRDDTRGERAAASAKLVILDGFDMDDLPDERAPPDDEWRQAEREERWQVCLERLENSAAVSPRDIEAFRVYVIRGEPARRVAKRLGIKRDRLYGIKHEMMQRLRKLREELDAELGEV